MVKNRDDRYRDTRVEGVRSNDAFALHSMIMEYVEATDDDAAAVTLENIERFLASPTLASNPDLLLEVSSHACSPFTDAVHLPFSAKVECDHSLRVAKSLALIGELTHAAHDIIKSGKLAFARRYALLLCTPNNDGYTPLQSAVAVGNHEIYNAIVQELKYLNDLTFRHGKIILSNDEYREQFIRSNKAGYTVKESAARTGNRDLIAAVEHDLTTPLPIRKFKPCAVNGQPGKASPSLPKMQ